MSLHNHPGGIQWGEGGARWSGEFEDPRFIENINDCRVYATETQRRPNLGPGVYRLPKLAPGISAKFSAPVGKVADRFEDGVGFLRGETEDNPDFGPSKYDVVKYDTWPGHGVKAPRLSPSIGNFTIPKEPRFHLSLYERLEMERRSMQQPLAAKGLPLSEIPRFSIGHRFTPREQFVVPDPTQYMRKGHGRFLSAQHRPPQKRTMVRMSELLRSQSKQEAPKKVWEEWMGTAQDEDPFKGLGPYIGYAGSLAHAAKFAPNFAKCGIASLVPRDESTVIGASVSETASNPALAPGAGFDNQDQVLAERSWGRWTAWERWKDQSCRGRQPGEVCPVVAQAISEKQAKRKRKLDPSHGTIQSRWHGMLRESVDRGESWAKRPPKYEDAASKSKASSKATSRTTTPAASPQVNVKTSSDAVVSSMTI